MKHRIINGDCEEVLEQMLGNLTSVSCIFADPPDNISLKYGAYNDSMDDTMYATWLERCLGLFVEVADTTWLSFNSKWILEVGAIVFALKRMNAPHLHVKFCVQTFTFGQHNQHDLGNNHRPLVRLRWSHAKSYPDNIRIPSWRQLRGDKRADPRGKVPGDVFDFPRVTGNSKQRRKWIKTQLHEGLIERCVKLSTQWGDTVFDPFGGSGTTLRVCKRINRSCTTSEIDAEYCAHIAAENDLQVESMETTI